MRHLKTLIIVTFIFASFGSLNAQDKPSKKVASTKKVISDYKKLNTPMSLLVLFAGRKPKTVNC